MVTDSNEAVSRSITSPLCGVCQREADVMATVPMCGRRPRYPLCHGCLESLVWCEYAEEVVPLSTPLRSSVEVVDLRVCVERGCQPGNHRCGQ